MRSIEEIKADIARVGLCDVPKCTLRKNLNIGCHSCSAIPCTDDNKLLFEYLRAVKGDISNERFEEICKAEKYKRLVELPCKVGDTVYWVSPFKSGIQSGDVSSITISGFGIDLSIFNGDKYTKREFEKVFLNYEQAEQALKGGLK